MCQHTLYKGGKGGGVAGESLYTIQQWWGGEGKGGVQGLNRGVDTRSATQVPPSLSVVTARLKV